jgi:hypothetical protein
MISSARSRNDQEILSPSETWRHKGLGAGHRQFVDKQFAEAAMRLLGTE